MARDFIIPEFYRSPGISRLKQIRNSRDQRKKDFSPAILDLGKIRFKIARHFGFCYGVQNAIEIAYRALEENPGKRIFLLSEMIHNPHVNQDLNARGIGFLRTAEGEQLIPFAELTPDDVVIIPAFGTTTDLFARLSELGINPYKYNTTCPFVEKVWKRSEQLGEKGYSIIVHGKYNHEETRATFSHASVKAPTIVVRDIEMARHLARFIKGELGADQFMKDFAGRFTTQFEFEKDLKRIGVVNQTTMLATETHEISELLRQAMIDRYGRDNIAYHFADTRDTLCYATSENQRSVYSLIEESGDLAIIVGGYNSSNTSHLVELCEQRLPAYHIKDASEIIGVDCIRHLDYKTGLVTETQKWFPLNKEKIDILITAGASCPDALVDQVLKKIASLSKLDLEVAEAIQSFTA